ncbi:MAG: sterol desaturase family protein [Elusimicrobia bacterium]|nr:sterol desaturase family protein [Elusimicrobiota bacterium]
MTPSLDEALWTALLRRPASGWRARLLGAWTAAGLLGLIALAWAEPFSGRLFARLAAAGAPPALIAWILKPLVMALRGVLLVESFGYAYHRFFQHVGRLTRRSSVIRRNQMYHWLHHMVIYPIGRFYKRDTGYVASETGLALSWVVPGWIAAGLAFWTMGVHPGTFAFLGGVAAYAKLVVDETHSRFHLEKHPWADSGYFHWLEDIHLLHHWDQAKNFTIVHPLMDRLFGTYLAPETHRAEIEAVVDGDALTVSDATNWRYLLKEATPAEHAAFISQARRHPRSVRKLELLLACLDRRLARVPAEVEALDLHIRAQSLLALVRPAPSAA